MWDYIQYVKSAFLAYIFCPRIVILFQEKKEKKDLVLSLVDSYHKWKISMSSILNLLLLGLFIVCLWGIDGSLGCMFVVFAE